MEVTKDNLFNQIAAVICAGEEVSMEALCAPDRHQEIVFARQLVLYFAKEFNIGSLYYIGRKLNRDHATVIHSIKTIGDYLITDKIKAAKIQDYREKLGCVEKTVTALNILQDEIAKIKFELSEVQNKALNVQLALRAIEDEISQVKLA